MADIVIKELRSIQLLWFSIKSKVVLKTVNTILREVTNYYNILEIKFSATMKFMVNWKSMECHSNEFYDYKPNTQCFLHES